MQPLFNYLKQFHTLSNEFTRHYEQHCSLVHIKKHKFVLSPLDTNNSIFFLLQGVVRGFIKEDKKDISIWFGFENQFIEAVRNPDLQSNYSTEYIQAIEDCVLIRIPYNLTNFLYANYPEANVLARKLLAVLYFQATERSTLARIPTALGRYLKLEESNMDTRRVPQRYLASYLGMRLETLSRIRNKPSEIKILKTA